MPHIVRPITLMIVRTTHQNPNHQQRIAPTPFALKRVSNTLTILKTVDVLAVLNIKPLGKDKTMPDVTEQTKERSLNKTTNIS